MLPCYIRLGGLEIQFSRSVSTRSALIIGTIRAQTNRQRTKGVSMARISRRLFLAKSSVISLAAWLKSFGEPSTPPPPPGNTIVTRPDAFSPAGQAMLQKYAAAVSQMKTTIAESSPTSWLFQWYTHAVRPDQAASRAIALNARDFLIGLKCQPACL